jgi:hypothetical protein
LERSSATVIVIKHYLTHKNLKGLLVVLVDYKSNSSVLTNAFEFSVLKGGGFAFACLALYGYKYAMHTTDNIRHT